MITIIWICKYSRNFLFISLQQHASFSITSRRTRPENEKFTALTFSAHLLAFIFWRKFELSPSFTWLSSDILIFSNMDAFKKAIYKYREIWNCVLASKKWKLVLSFDLIYSMLYFFITLFSWRRRLRWLAAWCTWKIWIDKCCS